MPVLQAAYCHAGIKLGKASLKGKVKACPVCGSLKNKKTGVIQENPDVWLMECPGCRAVYVSRMPSASALKKYYKSYYRDKKQAHSGPGVTMQSSKRFARRIFRAYNPGGRKREVSILDFGGGNGAVAAEIGRLFVEEKGFIKAGVTVIDESRVKCAACAKGVSMKSRAGLKNLKNRKFDIVIASAVLEHLPDPMGALRKLAAAVRPGGIFYARTSYVVPLMKALKVLGIKMDFGFPAHLYDFGREFWENAVEMLPGKKRYRIITAGPSMAESSFRAHFFRTIAAYVLKFPWYFFRKSYGLVGAWEVIIAKK